MCSMDGDQSFFWVQNFVLLPISLYYYFFFLKGLFCHNIPWFLEFFFRQFFFLETVSLNVSIPG